MCTARSSSCWGVCLSACWDTPLPGVGLEIPPGCGPGDSPGCGPGDPPRFGPGDPQVWAWRPPRPDPSTFPFGCGPGDPLARPLNFPLGCGPGNLQACWDTTPSRDLLQGMLGYHLQCMMGYHCPLVNRITDMRKNITLPQLCCRR